MSNIDKYADYYVNKPEFKCLFDERLMKGQLRGWTTESKDKLNKLSLEFAKFTGKDISQSPY